MIRFWILWREKGEDNDCMCLVILERLTWGRMEEMKYDTLDRLMVVEYPRFV